MPPWLSRFLDSRWFIPALALPGAIMLGISAPSSWFSAIALTVVACSWIVLAALNGHAWRRTITSWGGTLRSWESTTEYAKAMESLLLEALNELSTWDGERSIEIAKRAETISRLHFQNVSERREPVD